MTPVPSVEERGKKWGWTTGLRDIALPFLPSVIERDWKG